MTASKRWRKAALSSLFLHAVVLAAAGVFVALAPVSPPVAEPYLELELVGGGGGGGRPANESTAPAVPSARPEVSKIPEVRQAEVPQVVTPVAELPVLAAEAPAGTAGTEATGSGAGSGSGSGEGSGSGTGSGAGDGTGPGSGSGSGSLSAPGILAKVDPAYPERARMAGWEGVVVLRIQIKETGRPGSIEVVRSSGYGVLDEAAVDAVERWRFIPAKNSVSGQAVACYTSLPVVFKLH